MKLLCCFPALLWAATTPFTSAGSATWSSNPASGDWNTAANWLPNTVPNGPSDIASFGVSGVTTLLTNTTIELDSIVFESGASGFAITSGEGTNLILSGAGIVNNSGVVQSLTKLPNGAAIFSNYATAGHMTSYSGTFIFFNDSSSAGSASFEVASSGIYQAFIQFLDNATAADATIDVRFGVASVYDNATAGNAVFTLRSGAVLFIADSATADHATATCMGGDGMSSSIDFQQFGSAGEGHFTAVGAGSSAEEGSDIEFTGSATGANGAFVIEGGAAADLAGASMTMRDTSTAGNATITITGGVGGGEGGAIIFRDRAKGGNASLSLLGNSELDITNRAAPGVTIGSLAGEGTVLLGAKTLTIGSNNGSTTFSGVIQDTGGVAKSGSGTLTVTGASTYTGSTTVSGGVLRANNKDGSATGTGSVKVNSGTLGGKGMITGPVTIGTGSGAGAILAPSVGSRQPLTLSLTNSLTCKADSTYTCQLSTSKRTADAVIAKGVTIASGAQFSLQAVGNKRLSVGAVFTLISNTAATPISGTFANLVDGSTLAAGRNKLLVSYTGGDGNDLTLTVQ